MCVFIDDHAHVLTRVRCSCPPRLLQRRRELSGTGAGLLSAASAAEAEVVQRVDATAAGTLLEAVEAALAQWSGAWLPLLPRVCSGGPARVGVASLRPLWPDPHLCLRALRCCMQAPTSST